MGSGFEQRLLKEEIKWLMPKKYLKKWSTSLVTREMQIKITKIFILLKSGCSRQRKLKAANVDKDAVDQIPSRRHKPCLATSSLVPTSNQGLISPNCKLETSKFIGLTYKVMSEACMVLFGYSWEICCSLKGHWKPSWPGITK